MPTRVSFHDDPAAAVEGVALVQENGPENLDVKRTLFARIDAALAPETVVASSTSGFMPSELQAGRRGPERYVVGHPFNPPHLIPLVEVVGGRATDPVVVDWTAGFYAALGKRPIRIRREVPGHVANRMQVALYREAIHLVLEDVASIEDVDAAIAYGPGLRWALMGPHMAHHLAGGRGGLRHLLEHIGPGIERWWNDLGRPDLTPAAIDRLVEAFDAGRDAPDRAAGGGAGRAAGRSPGDLADHAPPTRRPRARSRDMSGHRAYWSLRSARSRCLERRELHRQAAPIAPRGP